MSDVPDAHLAVVSDKTTGKFHGALYRNRPTPSGCVRYRLQVTLNEGHDSMRAAAESANKAFPDVDPLDLDAIAAGDVDLSGIRIPAGAVVTRLTPRRGKDAAGEAPSVEVTLAGKPLDVAVTHAQFERMLELGHLELESSSGSDPKLHYRYDHYDLTQAGRNVLGQRKAA